MSSNRTLPDYVYLPPAAAQHYAKATRKGRYELLPSEVEWRDRQKHLAQRGYLLRPRYFENWKPSWIGTNIHPHFCEDSIILIVSSDGFSCGNLSSYRRSQQNYHVIDATRQRDGKRVAIKVILNDSDELHIAEYLASVRGEEHHCVTALDVLQDPLDAQRSLLVMPFLRPYNNPEFQLFGEIVDFVGQMLDVCIFSFSEAIILTSVLCS